MTPLWSSWAAGATAASSAHYSALSLSPSPPTPAVVIVVKDEAMDRPVGKKHRVVVGTDGSAEAAAAVDFAAERAA